MNILKSPISTTSKFINRQWFLLSILCILLSVGIGLIIPLQAAGQADDGWTDPINLSHSGSTSNPQIVADNEGLVHVIWEDEYAGGDEYAGWVYSFFDGELWSEPEVVNFPFDVDELEGEPKFAIDGRGRIHAFWLDVEGSVNYSWVNASRFGDSSSWAGRQVIAASALTLEVTSDSEGDVHLVYVRPLQTFDVPAGVYYRRSVNKGDSWLSAVRLYQSPYFRELTEDNASVDIATAFVGEDVRVYVTWDNHPRSQTFFARSFDGGETWFEPVEIDRPQASLGSATPYGIKTGALGEGVLLLWERGEPGVSCSLYFQWSPDGGGTWTSPPRALEKLSGCSQDNQIYTHDLGYLLLQISLPGGEYLLAWEGNWWSEPQAQPILSNFEEPEILATVDLGCLETTLAGNNQLFAVGCDTGRGGDIWLTSRSVDDLSAWFPLPSVWSVPETITSSNFDLTSPTVLIDAEERIHILWNQVDDSSTSNPVTKIYYTSLVGDGWISPVPVLVSPEGDTLQPVAALDNQGRILVVWKSVSSGQLYFAWSSAERASSTREWTSPLALPANHPVSRSPDILSDGAGTIYVTYVIPLNEQRGVYLIQSADGGATWSSPQLVFDAQVAGWDMVDNPHLASTSDGALHILFQRYTLPGDSGSLGLYYTKSPDGGETWTDPQLVSEQPVVWNRIFTSGKNTIHNIWVEQGLRQSSLRYQSSPDGGQNWSETGSFSSFSDLLYLNMPALDPAGQLHLVQVSESIQGQTRLEHWTWEGEHWVSQESLDLRDYTFTDEDQLNVSFSLSGRIAAVYTGMSTVGAESTESRELFITSRQWTLAGALSTEVVLPQPTESSALSSTPTLESTPSGTIPSIPMESPTPTASNALPLADQTEFQTPRTAGNQWLGIILGVLLAVILVAVSFSVAVMLRRRQ